MVQARNFIREKMGLLPIYTEITAADLENARAAELWLDELRLNKPHCRCVLIPVTDNSPSSQTTQQN